MYNGAPCDIGIDNKVESTLKGHGILLSQRLDRGWEARKSLRARIFRERRNFQPREKTATTIVQCRHRKPGEGPAGRGSQSQPLREDDGKILPKVQRKTCAKSLATESLVNSFDSMV
jgi:hypothetical protein